MGLVLFGRNDTTTEKTQDMKLLVFARVKKKAKI